MGFMEKLFGDANEKEVKRIERIADQVLALEGQMASLSDEELKNKTAEFKGRLGKGETLDDLLVEAFAVCREAAWRTLGMKHFRVQIIGGIVLHEGNIAEMKTGEGKTLVATLPVYLNALEGKGVHVVTVNDYLAKRDAEWMGQIYTFLGLTVGCVIHAIEGEDRKAAYRADITYGTNNEFGFDYLRDNMVVYKEMLIQRPLHYAIVDEVDSILIDEARTPLIISGAGGKSTSMYQTADQFVQRLRLETDFTLDEKNKTVALTEEGVAKIEEHFKLENFSDPENMELNHHILAALKANNLMKRDVDYIIKDGEIIIVDEFTGRLMFGRRYSNGLHQAIEAKEHVEVQGESKTLATITLQNYFRMYDKLSGMTGTAKTEEDEFREIYNMNVVEIPTNKPVAREDRNDSIYATARGKYKALVEEIVRRHDTGQPVLVGTISIEKSELISDMLRRRGVPHKVLNAKQHEREAEIIAAAGQKDAVTIATNMAGRGTDIRLGEGVVELGGLAILGSERHESRRIDNQLRGRAGRQGDPGSTQFFLSMEDDLMRLFGGERAQMFIERMGIREDEPIEAGMLSKTIESAQKKVEGRNFGIRKSVLGYDDVMNRQRTIIYDERRRVLDGEDLTEHIQGMIEDIVRGTVLAAANEGTPVDQWDWSALERNLRQVYRAFPGYHYSEEEKASLTPEALVNDTLETFMEGYRAKEQEIGAENMRNIERMVLLRVVDNRWMDHIDNMDQLRQGIGLRALGQQDPVQAYAQDGFDMFDEMIEGIKEDTVRFTYGITLRTDSERKVVTAIGEGRHDEAVPMGAEPVKKPLSDAQQRMLRDTMPKAAPKEIKTANHMPVHKEKEPGRNDPCPCGSGKKYKNCCGKNK